MNPSVTSLMEALRRGLRESVQPELQTDYARSQLAATVDILGKLERMMDWSFDMQREAAAPLEAMLLLVTEQAAEAGLPIPAALAAAGEPVAQATGQALQDRETQTRAAIDWLFDHRAALPAPVQQELDAAVRLALRGSVAAQRRRISRSDFSSMTASSN